MDLTSQMLIWESHYNVFNSTWTNPEILLVHCSVTFLSTKLLNCLSEGMGKNMPSLNEDQRFKQAFKQQSFRRFLQLFSRKAG